MNTSGKDVRVRIAPSPTGDPHVGTAYIALFNYVFARKHGGSFVLRIEDTDQSRSRSTSEQQILDSLAWLGLQWDEGPDVGGANGPYRQSERKHIYKEHAQQLVDGGKAYPCFCTAERLYALREQQKEQGLRTRYDGHCRDLSADEVQGRQAAGEDFVIRLKMPQDGQTCFRDELRGMLSFENEIIDDQVLIKTDGFPTYHLANVVDDHLMKISHVIRAEEWISSTPKHVQLYQAFGWDEPQWIHMPLLRNSDKSKISKRKNPVSLAYYRRAGILPEALRNFLGLMGWSYGDDQEIFSLQQMIEVFDFKSVSLGGPIFDIVKLNWLNQTYMHQMDSKQFAHYLREEVFTEEFLMRLQPLALERMTRFEQFVDKNAFFFNGELDYSQVDLVPKGLSGSLLRKMLKDLVERLDELYDWDAASIQALLDEHRKEIEWKPKDYYMTIRLITTGRKDSPPLNQSMELIGRDMCRFRIRQVIDHPSLKG